MRNTSIALTLAQGLKPSEKESLLRFRAMQKSLRTTSRDVPLSSDEQDSLSALRLVERGSTLHGERSVRLTKLGEEVYWLLVTSRDR